MDGLFGDTERPGDLDPVPTLIDRSLHGGRFEPVGEPPQGHDRSQGFDRVAWIRHLLNHTVNLS